MKQETKKWGVLTAAVLLSLSAWGLPQSAMASTSYGGNGSTQGSASATGESSTAVGDSSKATGKYSIAMGFRAEALGTKPTEAQEEDKEFNGGTIAIGYYTKAEGNYSTVLGYASATTSTGRKGIAVGNQVTVSGDSAIGIGQHMSVGGEETVAIGYGVVTAKTTQSYDETTKETTTTTTAANGVTAIGSRSEAINNFSSALGYGAQAYGSYSMALGASSKTGQWVATGYDTTSQSYVYTYVGGGDYSIALGNNTVAAGNYSVALGYGAQAGVISSDYKQIYGLATAVGMGAGAFAANSTALGAGAQIYDTATGSISIGSSALVYDNATYAGAIGTSAQALKAGSLAIGYQALADTAQTQENATTGAADTSGVTVSTVSFGHKSTDVPYKYDEKEGYIKGDAYGTTVLSRLTNIAVGKSDTDAVNFSQIKITAPTSGTTYLKSTLNSDGSINSNGTIGANLTTLDSHVVALDGLVSLNNGKISVGAGDSAKSATEVSIAGTNNRKLTGVAYDTDNHSAAAYGQMIAAGTYSATGNDRSKAQTVTLAYNDESSNTNKVVISLDATGAVQEGDKRLVDGGTVYTAIKNATKTYTGSDTVTVSTDNKISVKNMAMGNSAGKGATATGTSSMAIGDGASVSQNYSIAIGTDVTVVQKEVEKEGQKVKTNKAIAVGLGTNVSGDSAIAIGQYMDVGGEETVAIGYGVTTAQTTDGVTTAADGATGIGSRSTASAQFASALGYGSAASGIASVALGAGAAAQDTAAVSIGFQSLAYKAGAVSVGTLSQAVGNSSTALGTSSHANGDASLAIGAGSWTYTDTDNSIAVGNTAVTWSKNAAAFGYQAVASAEKTVSFGHAKDDQYITKQDDAFVIAKYKDDYFTTLTNVQGGTKKNEVATWDQLIGSASYNAATGKLTFTKNDESTIEVTISSSGGGGGEGGTTYAAGNGIEFSSDTTPKISVKVDGDDLVAGEKGLSVKKDGKVEAGNTGLVTGGTVHDALQSMDNRLSDDINKVGAGAAALSALRPEGGFNPLDKWSFAVGYGHYKNANAGALGAFFKPNADTTLSLGGTIGNGDPMLNAGVSFKLGSRGKVLPQNANNSQLVQEVNSLRAQNTAQQNEIAALRADNQRMQQQIAQILSKMEMSGKVSRTAK